MPCTMAMAQAASITIDPAKRLATSLGGPETLVTHPASTTHVNLLPEELADAGITPATVRMSVGLEDTDDVVADVRRALDAAFA